MNRAETLRKGAGEDKNIGEWKDLLIWKRVLTCRCPQDSVRPGLSIVRLFGAANQWAAYSSAWAKTMLPTITAPPAASSTAPLAMSSASRRCG